jgi:GR25 family glycosyltransferase involved in LPS biosynthesis
MITRVISLGGERLESFEKRMQGKFKYSVFDAFTPDQIVDVEEFFKESDIFDYAHERDPYAVMACAKSHLWLWIECILLDREVLILEDDVKFSDEAAEKAFNYFIKILNEDYVYDVFFFDGEWGEKYVVSPAHKFHSGCAYVMTPEGAKKILNKVETKGFDRAVDWEILNSQDYGVKALAFERAILVPSGEKSTLKV